jgi:hypothetical protein
MSLKDLYSTTGSESEYESRYETCNRSKYSIVVKHDRGEI